MLSVVGSVVVKGEMGREGVIRIAVVALPSPLQLKAVCQHPPTTTSTTNSTPGTQPLRGRHAGLEVLQDAQTEAVGTDSSGSALQHLVQNLGQVGMPTISCLACLPASDALRPGSLDKMCSLPATLHPRALHLIRITCHVSYINWARSVSAVSHSNVIVIHCSTPV